jgi:hypothetical protein
MTQVMSKAKWFVPIIVIVAMLAVVGIVWSQSSSGGVSDLGLTQLTDQNPAYDDQVVTPPDAGTLPAVLYSITMDPPTSTVPMLGGTVATVVVTNLIPAPISNGPCGVTADPITKVEIPVIALANGDITGDLYVTADIYNYVDLSGCLAVFDSAPGTKDGLPSAPDTVVKVYENITVHPGMTVTFQIPIIAGMGAVPGADFMIKAALYVPDSGGMIPWAPGYYELVAGTPIKTQPMVGMPIAVFGP